MVGRKSKRQYQRCFRTNFVCLDRFFSRRNIGLYRTLADESTGTVKRREILKLLAEEQIRFRSDLLRLTQVRSDRVSTGECRKAR
jgi:hypothetical protein